MESETRRQKEDLGVKRRDWNEETPEDEGSGDRLGCAGHIERMSEERLTKRAGKTEEAGRRRPILRWKKTKLKMEGERSCKDRGEQSRVRNNGRTS